MRIFDSGKRGRSPKRGTLTAEVKYKRHDPDILDEEKSAIACPFCGWHTVVRREDYRNVRSGDVVARCRHCKASHLGNDQTRALIKTIEYG